MFIPRTHTHTSHSQSRKDLNTLATIRLIMPYQKICQHCGKEYTTHYHAQKYCSVKCYGLDIKNPKKKCEHCGAEFQPAHSNQKFCRAKCYQLSTRIHFEGYSRRCQKCGEEFKPTRRNQKFCSIGCSRSVNSA